MHNSAVDTNEVHEALLTVASALEAAVAVLRRARVPPAVAVAAPSDERPRVAIALFDYTCLGLEPWRKRGYEVHAYDWRHPPGHTVTARGVHLHGVDLNDDAALAGVAAEHAGHQVGFAMAFPPCTDLSRAGARYWKAKGHADPHFQDTAVALVTRVQSVLEQFGCPYYIENPASSTLRSLWRPPDHTFEPCWYGGYLAHTDAHPTYPAHIPNQDAYTKRTGLWVGGGFHQMPPQRRVPPTFKEWTDGVTGKRRRVTPLLYSGGMEGKQARHATPRGFSEAMAQVYAS
jgi:hypothetical protein